MPRYLLILVLLVCHALSASALEVPQLRARVNDLGGVLTAEQVRSLEAKLQDLEATDSTQVAVLIIPSLEGEVLEDFSMRVASAWRLGQKGRDNGALVVIAMKERKIRIEAGYGLEPTLTDAKSRRIIQEEIVPRFKEGKFYEGIDAGVTAIIQVVRGQYTPLERSGRTPSGTSIGRFIHLGTFLFVPFFWLLGRSGKWGGAILGAAAGMFLSLVTAGLGLSPLLLGGVAGGAIGLLLAAMLQSARRKSGRRIGRSLGSRGWFYTGGGGPGFSSGEGFSGGNLSGGGDFSGGGGDFGGGGSSGSW